VKWDGYRALLLKDHNDIQLRSPNDNNLTAAYPTIHAAALQLTSETALLDGEIVALVPARLAFRGKKFSTLSCESTPVHAAKFNHRDSATALQLHARRTGWQLPDWESSRHQPSPQL